MAELTNAMEYIQENILPFLRDHSYTLLRRTFAALPRSTTDQLSSLQADFLEPYIVQPIATLLSLSSSDVLSVVIMLVVLYISLRVLDYARRLVMFWVMLVVRLAFWAGVLGIGFYVYNVGLERATVEAGWIWGVVQGFIQDFIADGEGQSAGRDGYGGGSGAGRGDSSRYGYQRSGRGKW